MCLNLKGLCTSEWVHDNLDAARFVYLTHAREECVSVVHHLELVQVDALLKLSNLLSVINLNDCLVIAGGEY